MLAPAGRCTAQTQWHAFPRLQADQRPAGGPTMGCRLFPNVRRSIVRILLLPAAGTPAYARRLRRHRGRRCIGLQMGKCAGVCASIFPAAAKSRNRVPLVVEGYSWATQCGQNREESAEWPDQQVLAAVCRALGGVPGALFPPDSTSELQPCL